MIGSKKGIGKISLCFILLIFMFTSISCTNSKPEVNDSVNLNREMITAIENNDCKTAEQLLNEGFDIDITIDNKTLFEIAAENANYSVGKLLYEKGINISKYTNSADLGEAIAGGNSAEVLSFIVKDINLEQKYQYDSPALLLASCYGFAPIAKMLIEAGANVNSTDSEGYTPLHVSCSEKHFDIIQMLLDAGANINAQNNNGKSALDIAQEYKETKVIKILTGEETADSLSNIELNDDKPNSYSYNATKTDAWVFAKDAVKSVLIAPSTADFPHYCEDFITDLGGNNFIIESYVDANNSYGAQIRKDFVVDITVTDEYSYVINDIQL